MNWLGLKIVPVTTQIEGTWKETTVEPELDERTGEIFEYRLGPFKQRYDIHGLRKI